MCSSDLLTWLFIADRRPDAAEDAVSRMVSPISEKGEELLVCQSHRLLDNIYVLQGEEKKAIHHFKTALGISTRFDWHHQLFQID